MCLGCAENILPFCLEKKGNPGPGAPNGLEHEGLRFVLASSWVKGGALFLLRCLVTGLGSLLPGGSALPSSLASPFPGWALGKDLLMWANGALSKSTQIAGKKLLLGRGGGWGGMDCSLVVELLFLR